MLGHMVTNLAMHLGCNATSDWRILMILRAGFILLNALDHAGYPETTNATENNKRYWNQ